MSVNVMQGLWKKQVIAGGGTDQIISMKGAPLPCTITATPLNSDTLTITLSTDDGTNYVAWPAGAVTAQTACYIDAPITHVKVACSGSGVASNVSIC